MKLPGRLGELSQFSRTRADHLQNRCAPVPKSHCSQGLHAEAAHLRLNPRLRTESPSTNIHTKRAPDRDLVRGLSIQLIAAVEGVEAFGHALEGQDMADHRAEVDVTVL